MADVDLSRLLDEARRTGDASALVAAIPAARFLGISLERGPGGLCALMDYAPHLVGNALIPALHGGTLGALLESVAIFSLLLDLDDASRVPKTISLTVEFLRNAGPVPTHARAEIVRQGRRVASVRAIAWQDDPERPVAAANAHFLLVPREGERG